MGETAVAKWASATGQSTTPSILLQVYLILSRASHADNRYLLTHDADRSQANTSFSRSFSNQSGLIPHNTIPFRRDPDFVGRDVLTQVLEKTATPASRVALVGLGGTGKSQLAIEYAHRISESRPSIWIFWVHASSAERFKDSYMRIAEWLGLLREDNQSGDILRKVYLWLSDSQNGNWVMIVDNADDDQVLFQSSNDLVERSSTPSQYLPSLSDYLPQSANGSVLVTSRSRKVAYRLVGRDQDILEVSRMDSDAALTLLRRKLKDASDQDGMLRLGEQVDYMPLALSQAAVYINQQAPKVSVRTYVQTLQRSYKDQLRLLQTDLGDPRRDGNASNSIILTLQISFEYIQQTSTSAACLLAWMSLFDRETIPVALLAKAYAKNRVRTTRTWPGFLKKISSGFGANRQTRSTTMPQRPASPECSTILSDDISTLRTYDLVHFGVSDDTLSMHRLVQLSVWKWLEQRKELEVWQAFFVDVLHATVPSGRRGGWLGSRKHLQHVMMLLPMNTLDREHSHRRNDVLFRAGRYAFDQGQYQTAEILARECWPTLKHDFGAEDHQSMRALELLATSLYQQEKNEESEGFLQELVTLQTKVLGSDDSATVMNTYYLSRVLDDRGKRQEAEELALKTLSNGQSNEEVHDVATLDVRILMLRRIGNYSEAEQVSRQLVEMTKQGGGQHLSIIWSMTMLMRCLYDQKKYHEARKVGEEALSMQNTESEDEQLLMIEAMDWLAASLRKCEEHDRAETLGWQVLKLRQKYFGSHHLNTYMCMCDLAQNLQSRSKLAEAKTLYEQGLDGLSKFPWLENDDKRQYRKNYAELRQEMGLGEP